MKVVFYRLQEEGAEYKSVAEIRDGEIVEGEENLPVIRPEHMEDPEALMRQFDGPYLVAADESDTPTEKTHWLTEPRLGKVGWYDENSGEYEYTGAHSAVRAFLDNGDTSALDVTKASLVKRDAASNLLKQDSDKWIPYKGPQEGEGWQRVGDGEVRYQQNPPGEVAEGYEEDHWRQNWPELETGEWDEDVPSAVDMKEDDLVLFVNRNGESEVARYQSATFVREEHWDSAKMGIELTDGREVLMDDIAAWADMTASVEPPTLEGDESWEKAPGVYTDYVPDNLVYFQNDDGDMSMGIVSGWAKSRNGVKIETAENFTVVDPDKISHYAEVDQFYNRGWAITESPFDDLKPIRDTERPPQPGFTEDYGATVEDVRGAFSQIFGGHLVDNLDEVIEEGDYDPEDPEDVVDAIVEYRGNDENPAWRTFKHEVRGRSVGMGKNRVERIIDEAFGLDIGDPQYEIRSELDNEETDNPEAWLRQAAFYAVQDGDGWVSLQSLQDAIDEWGQRGVPLNLRGVHDFEGEPDDVVALSETGTNSGISAGAMFIAEWSDGGRAFVTRIRDEQEHGSINSMFMESSVEAERAMTGYGVQNEVAQDNDSIRVPDHEYRFDEYFSVEGAPDDAVLADKFLETHETRGVDMPDGFPENDIVESMGADVEDVQEAFGSTVYPGWEEDEETLEIFENDPNLDRENPQDWVAAAKIRYDRDEAHVWNSFTEELASQTYESPVDKQTFMEMAAGGILAGNKDLHANNVMADEEGNLYPIDLDFSGYDMTEDRHLGNAVGQLVSTANSLGIEVSEEFEGEGDPDAFDKAKRPLGQEIIAFVNEYTDEEVVSRVRSGNPMYGARRMGDNVPRNAEAAKNGELEL